MKQCYINISNMLFMSIEGINLMKQCYINISMHYNQHFAIFLKHCVIYGCQLLYTWFMYTYHWFRQANHCRWTLDFALFTATCSSLSLLILLQYFTSQSLIRVPFTAFFTIEQWTQLRAICRYWSPYDQYTWALSVYILPMCTCL